MLRTIIDQAGFTQLFEEAHADGPLAVAKACGDFLAGRVTVAVASDQNDR